MAVNPNEQVSFYITLTLASLSVLSLLVMWFSDPMVLRYWKKIRNGIKQ